METLAISGGTPVHTAPWPRWPVFSKQEEQLLLDVFHSGNWWRHSYGQGVELTEDEEHPKSMVAQFQRKFARVHDCKYGICAANGTVTLEIALRGLGITPSSEVIVPAYTYIATATAPLMVGAIPIFVDIDPDTYNIAPWRIEEAITEHTRAIIPVHFGGQPCDMDAVNKIARKHNLQVIEDAAHAHGSSYRGKMCGSLAEIGSFSFQLSKNMTAGEGGILTMNNLSFAEKCESLVWAGRKSGHPWYQHFVLAGNARMTEFQGAILLAQLTRLQDQTRKRTASAQILDKLLSEIDGIKPLATLPTTSCNSYHIYMFRYHLDAFDGLDKHKFIQALQAEGIGGAFAGYTTPLYANPLFIEKNFYNGPWPVDIWEHGRKLDYSKFRDRCPVSERACSREAVWIPQSMLLADEDSMHDIAKAIKKIQTHAKQLL